MYIKIDPVFNFFDVVITLITQYHA